MGSNLKAEDLGLFDYLESQGYSEDEIEELRRDDFPCIPDAEDDFNDGASHEEKEIQKTEIKKPHKKKKIKRNPFKHSTQYEECMTNDYRDTKAEDDLEENTPFGTLGIYNLGIPAEVAFNPEVSKTEGYLFAIIRSLSQSSRGCYATNFYLSLYLLKDESTVKRGIVHLIKLGYIRAEYSVRKDGRTLRRLFIDDERSKKYKDIAVQFNNKVIETHNKIRKKHLEAIKHGVHFCTPSNTDMRLNNLNDVCENIKGFKNEPRRGVKKTRYRDSCNSDSSCLEHPSDVKCVSDETHNKKINSSMADKVRLKAKQNSGASSAKKSKLPVKIKYNTPDNINLIKFWNNQPGLRSCKISEENKTFSDSLKAIHKLKKGKLSDLLNTDTLRESTKIEWFSRSYIDLEIKKGVLNLSSQATKIDVYPMKKDWLKKLSISDAIYNKRLFCSPLLEALHYGVKPVFDPISKLTEDEKDAVKQLQTYFKVKHEKEGPKIDQQILQLVKEFKDLRLKHKLAWGDKYMLRQRGWHSAPVTVDCLVYDYIEFLTGRTVSNYEIPDSLEPYWLRQNSKAWNAFSMAYYHRYDVDVITGRG